MASRRDEAQALGHRGGEARAPARRGVKQIRDHGRQLRRGLRSCPQPERRRTPVLLLEQRRHRGPFMRRAAGDQLVEHDAEGIEIRPRAHGVVAEELLRRHVVRRTGEAHGLGRCRQRIDDVRDPEVGDLRHAIVAEENVAGLQIAVHDALRMRCREPREDLIHRAEQHGPAGPLVGPRVEIGALHQLHDEKDRTAHVGPHVEESHDVPVLELRDDGRLSQQHAPRAAVDALRDRLDGHAPSGAALDGLVDAAHPALPEQAKDLVAPQPFHGRHLSPIRDAWP